jgi:hypothetical protein
VFVGVVWGKYSTGCESADSRGGHRHMRIGRMLDFD